MTTLLESDTAFPGSVVEEEEESEGESGLEMVEGASDLEEEGVVLSEEKRHLARKVRGEGGRGEQERERSGQRKVEWEKRKSETYTQIERETGREMEGGERGKERRGKEERGREGREGGKERERKVWGR